MNEPKRTLEALELVGGVLCLDFANTINSRLKPEHDYLITYSDLVDWAGKVEMLSPQQVKTLKQRAAQEPKKSKEAFEKGTAARETIHRVFSAIARGSKHQEDDLITITHLYKEAVANSRLVKGASHYKIDWKMDESFGAPLWIIAASAENLLLSKELNQVKECPGCGWLFLDTSKNQSRRWCSMNTCGARDKMRRYHGRLRKK